MNNAFYFIISLFTNTLIITIDTQNPFPTKKKIITQKRSFQFAVNFHMNSFVIYHNYDHQIDWRYWIVFELRHFHMRPNILMIAKNDNKKCL